MIISHYLINYQVKKRSNEKTQHEKTQEKEVLTEEKQGSIIDNELFLEKET
jgi:hypothetical protein